MTDALPSQQDAPRGASQQTADRIRAYIQSEGLKAGDRIGREADLAGLFGISRPTLREALRLLASAHLIRAAKGPGGGIFVAATPEDGIARTVTDAIASMMSAHDIGLDELLETRLLLEPPLAGLAARRATQDDVVDLRRLVDELAGSVNDPVAFGDADIAIHRAVARVARNRLASAFSAWIAELLLPSIRDRMAPALVEDVIVSQQRDLADAIAEGDPNAAERAMREHLVYTLDVASAVAPSPADHR